LRGCIDYLFFCVCKQSQEHTRTLDCLPDSLVDDRESFFALFK
jgi:hypothetical protein